jgi:LacI family transcriptional regulator
MAAGVSVSTVSRVLNEKDDVSIETYDRVRNVIDELGYASSLAARGMRSRRTHVIGMIVPEVGSPYWNEILRGVNRVISSSLYDLIIYTTGNLHKHRTEDRERQFVSLLNGGIADGVIVVTPVATVFSTDAPVVAIDPNKESPDYAGIIAMNREGALTAMSYLTGLGHRRIGFITGRLDLLSGCQRLQGYKDGLEAAHLPIDEALIQEGDYTTETAAGCALNLLALSERPSAIFASNDMSAVGVYRAAGQVGLRVPEDLSVIGFDNLPEAAHLKPALTTMDQSVSEMGSIATEMILKLVKGETLEKNLYKIPTRLVVRDSCVPIH